MQKITPFLWFDGRAEEAADFYLSIFKNSSVVDKFYMGNTSAVASVTVQLEGNEYHLFNGGPHFSFTPAVSLFVSCETQAEVDNLWDKLSAGGEKSRCGWLKDKFGLSWQVIPVQLGKLLNDPDPAKSKRVMDAMLQMNKLNIDGLQKAYSASV